ncbi:MAG: FHA domain-containing protein [Myxococcales bacterium]
MSSSSKPKPPPPLAPPADDLEDSIAQLPSDVPDDFDDAIDRFGEQPQEESPWSGGTVVASIPIPLEDDVQLPDVAKEKGATIASTMIEPLPDHVSAMVEFEDSATHFQVTKTVTVIGRAAGAADLVLPWNEEASRQHCAVLYAQRTFWLEDLQSSNGTFVNEQPVARVRLKSGDKIRIGTQVLVLRFRV